jgi:hypothetical protein
MGEAIEHVPTGNMDDCNVDDLKQRWKSVTNDPCSPFQKRVSTTA